MTIGRRLGGRGPFNYQVVRDNFKWPDHIFRVLVSGSCVAYTAPESVADPACGDASVLEAAYRQRPFQKAYLSDISAKGISSIYPTFPNEKRVCDLLEGIARIPEVDTMVLTETLEHVEDPNLVLQAARDKAKWLVASSPNGEPEGYINPEHLWEWNKAEYRQLLEFNGWAPQTFTLLDFPMHEGKALVIYEFQIWVAERA